jgi:hypothetical protein
MDCPFAKTKLVHEQEVNLETYKMQRNRCDGVD